MKLQKKLCLKASIKSISIILLLVYLSFILLQLPVLGKIPKEIEVLSNKTSSSITVEQAVVLIMEKMSKLTDKGAPLTAYAKTGSVWAIPYLNTAMKNKWLSQQKPPVLKNKISKKQLTSIFLSIAGFPFYKNSVLSEQQKAIDEMAKSVNKYAGVAKDTSDPKNNITATVADISKLVEQYKYKTLGWMSMSPAWSFYSNRKLDIAMKIFEFCYSAGEKAGVNKKDIANAIYGFAAINGDNDVRNFDAAYAFADKAIKTSPGSDGANNAQKLIQKLKDKNISRELGYDYSPNKLMTYEDLMAGLAYHCYFKLTSIPEGFSITDKNGKLPSVWARKFVYYFASNKNGSLMPSVPESFTAPVPRYWAASLFARSAGFSNFEYDRYIRFNDLDNLSSNDRMFINISLDRGLFPFQNGGNFNPKSTFKRSELKDLVQRFYNNSFKNKKPGEKAVFDKTTYPKTVAAYVADDGVSQFSFQKSIMSKNKDRVNILNFHAIYDVSSGDHTSDFLNSKYKNEGTKYLKTRFDLTPEIREALSEAKVSGIKRFVNLGYREERAYNIFKDENKRSDVVDDLVRILELYNMEGVEITFEYLPVDARESFTDFIKQLSQKLHAKEKQLIVAVGAYSSDDYEAKSAFDLAVLGQVSDFVSVILYDDFPLSKYLEGKTKDGPISRIDWNTRILNYMVQKVPSKKILLGIGAYANDFDLEERKQSIQVTLNKLEDRIKQNAVADSIKYLFDEVTKSPYIEYSDKKGHSHRVWYEDEKSFSSRIQGVHKYELGGIFFYKFASDSADLNKVIDQELR